MILLVVKAKKVIGQLNIVCVDLFSQVYVALNFPRQLHVLVGIHCRGVFLIHREFEMLTCMLFMTCIIRGDAKKSISGNLGATAVRRECHSSLPVHLLWQQIVGGG